MEYSVLKFFFSSKVLWVSLMSGILSCGQDVSNGKNGSGESTEDAAFAVVRSDRSSTSIATLGLDGALLDPSVLSSASAAPGLSTALSGDVVLADLRPADQVLNIIDRLFTDVLTRYDLRTNQVLGQLALEGLSNPYDFTIVSPSSAWVTRFGVNLDPAAGPLLQGSDLLEFNPTSLSLTGRRVDLSRFQTMVSAEGETGAVSVDVFPRPSSVVRVNGTMAVGLARFSAAFDAAAPGLVALVDPVDLSVRSVSLGEHLRNCGSVHEVPNRPDWVVVACSGFARPFGDPPQVRASSGVVWVRVRDDGSGEVVRRWEPRDDASWELSVQNVLPVSETEFVGLSFGVFGERGDRFFWVDAEEGTQELLFETDEPFAGGGGAFDPNSQLLIIPDASASGGGLRRYALDPEGRPTRLETITFSDGPLPPRSVYLLR